MSTDSEGGGAAGGDAGVLGPRPGWSELARHWMLERGTVFLNHGSFGATPIAVLEAQREVRDELEREPLRFMVERLEGQLDGARGELGAFMGCGGDDLAFVVNATMGVNTVVRSLAWEPGDELLTSTHEYNACNNALEYVAQRHGARVVRAELPFPVRGEQEVVDAVLERVTARTRLVLLSHITSPTGLILPVERLVRELAARGIDTLVDGAHAPGMVPLEIDRIGAAYYTGNLHKWVCAPKGAAFLHVRKDRQRLIRPLIVSHGANSARTDRPLFRLEMDYLGTLDYSAWLAAPAAVRFMGSLLPGGWEEVRRRNHGLALRARDVLCGALGVAPPAPDEMLGSMAAAPLPDRGEGEGEPVKYMDPLQDRLVGRYGIQVPVFPFPAPPKRLVRVAAQVYNDLGQYEYLARALRRELGMEG